MFKKIIFYNLSMILYKKKLHLKIHQRMCIKYQNYIDIFFRKILNMQFNLYLKIYND